MAEGKHNLFIESVRQQRTARSRSRPVHDDTLPLLPEFVGAITNPLSPKAVTGFFAKSIEIQQKREKEIRNLAGNFGFSKESLLALKDVALKTDTPLKDLVANIESMRLKMLGTAEESKKLTDRFTKGGISLGEIVQAKESPIAFLGTFSRYFGTQDRDQQGKILEELLGKEGLHIRKALEVISKEGLATARFDTIENRVASSLGLDPAVLASLHPVEVRDLIDRQKAFVDRGLFPALEEYFKLREELIPFVEDVKKLIPQVRETKKDLEGVKKQTLKQRRSEKDQKQEEAADILDQEEGERLRQAQKDAKDFRDSLALSPQTLEQFKTLKDYICEAKRCMQELKQAAEEMKVPALPQGAGALEEEGFGDDDFEDFFSDFSPTPGETPFFPTQTDKKPAKSPGTISEEIGKVNPAVAQLKNTFEALESGILQTLNGIFQGSQTFAEGMKNLFRNLALSLAQDILKLTVLDPLKKGLGSLLEGLSGGIAGGILKFFGFKAAQGGLLPGHFAPVRAFAGGGVIDRPTFGFVGEGSMPEAVVPLPDRRNIPVRLMGEERQRAIQITEMLREYLMGLTLKAPSYFPF